MQVSSPGLLRCSLVLTLPQALVVRTLRNTCREYLTNFQQPLSTWQQVRWFYRTYQPALRKGDYRVYLFTPSRGRPVGYGALSLQDEALYITECVAPTGRGQGYGRQILAALTTIAQAERRPLVAEIWASNKPSIRLHTSAGFRLVEVRDHAEAPLHVYRLD